MYMYKQGIFVIKRENGLKTFFTFIKTNLPVTLRGKWF